MTPCERKAMKKMKKVMALRKSGKLRPMMRGGMRGMMR
jgi:hypothetical protein